MSNYPTPPPTSSPKDHINHSQYQHVFSHQEQPHQTRQDTYHSYSPPNIPAQDSYYLSNSAPSSPKPNRQDQQYHDVLRPMRMNSAPKPTAYTSNNARPPPRRRTPPPPPRPIYYSPTNKPPSPYNTARPRPRAGYIKRLTAKIEEWVRGFIRWAKRNPIKAGLAAFVPLVALAGFAKAVHGAVLLGTELLGGKEDKKEEDEEKKKEREKRIKGWGMDKFVGFGGSKGGPVEGMLKILQMLVNHYCKLSPSMVPRLGSLLLEVYFLDKLH